MSWAAVTPDQALLMARLSGPAADLLGQIADAGLPMPVLEHRFHPVRRWRFDFSWPALLVAVEVDGGVFGARLGRHTTGEGYTKDCEKLNTAATMGWLCLRMTPPMVRDGTALDHLRLALAARGWGGPEIAHEKRAARGNTEEIAQ